MFWLPAGLALSDPILCATCCVRMQQLRVTNLDTLTYSGSLENLQELPNPDHYTFVKGDICDADLVRRLLREHAIDTIVHFAAETHVDRSILVPGQFVQTNIVGTFTLLGRGPPGLA